MMEKGLYIHNGDPSDLVGLYFTERSVTLRTFFRIGSPAALLQLEEVRNGGEGLDARNLQFTKEPELPSEDVPPPPPPPPPPEAGVKGTEAKGAEQQVLERTPKRSGVRPENKRNEEKKLLKARFDLLTASALDENVLTASAQDLTGRNIRISGKIYRVYRQSTYAVSEEVWTPYSEVCMTLMRNANRYPGRHMLAFFDRNAHTYNGRESFRQFHTKFKLTNSYVAFRWLVLPGTNLLTAPVICNPNARVITNLEMGKDINLGDRITDRQQARTDQEIEAFRAYWLPQASIIGPDSIKPDATLELQVRCSHQGGRPCPYAHDYMLEVLSGYAPIRRVSVSGGVGRFRVSALGLLPGEKLRIKLNDKYWAGVAEKTLTVV